MYATDGRTKATLIASFRKGGGIIIAGAAVLSRSSHASRGFNHVVDLLDAGDGAGRRCQRLLADERTLRTTSTSGVRHWSVSLRHTLPLIS